MSEAEYKKWEARLREVHNHIYKAEDRLQALEERVKQERERLTAVGADLSQKMRGLTRTDRSITEELATLTERVEKLEEKYNRIDTWISTIAQPLADWVCSNCGVMTVKQASCPNCGTPGQEEKE